MSYDPDGAIKVLQDGLSPDMPHTFAQADGLVSSIAMPIGVLKCAWRCTNVGVCHSLSSSLRGRCFRNADTKSLPMHSSVSLKSIAGMFGFALPMGF